MINAPDTPPEFERQLAVLRARFTSGLGARRDELTAAWSEWNALAGTPDAERPRAVLAIALHRLAGAALSYGFETIGQAARTLEGRITADGAQLDGLSTPFGALVAGIDDAYAGAAGASRAAPDTPPAAQ
ncbi:chemotaxis protein [Burkholderia sp. Ac-20379]|uniref:chemotaxis protein n=1 Tax=Burkholderia sp. Ac-20379 TaxID=2703900 RepID=UPI001980B796|nr:chemotaxis protein [Burkholderia sp. Ac-20379]